MEHVKIDETKLEEYGLLAKDWCLVNGKYNHTLFLKKDPIPYFISNFELSKCTF
jgi:hypothetical protein